MAIPDTQWRLTLDNPAPFSTENGYIRTAHCADFRASDIPPVGTFRDPLTGLVLLTPSIFSNTFQSDFKELSQWTVQSEWWQSARRAFDPAGAGTGTAAPFLATIKPAGKPPTNIELLIVDAALAIYNGTSGDTLVWAAQSNFLMGADEGFAVHYHGLNDEMLRKHNWFAVQWGDLFVHFDSNGIIRVYAYPGGDTTGTPVQFDEFNISSPGEIYNRAGYFWFLPIPGIGLNVYHSLSAQFLETQGANANAGAVRGHTVKLPASLLPGGNTLIASSAVNLALNPYLDHLFGFQNLSFPGTGVYTDAPFDPGTYPTTSPSFTHIALPTEQQTVVPSLLTEDGSAAWAAGDGSARVQLALSTSDPRYTPFVFGYQVEWPGVFGVRAPVPLQILWHSAGRADRMMRLEFADDEYERFEGSVELALGSALGREIAERGDATFLLEKSLDGGHTWIIHAGGLARMTSGATYEQAGGMSWYHTTWVLKDFWDRLDEVHQAMPLSVDGLPIIFAFGAILRMSGFPDLSSYPPELMTRLLPGVTGDQQYQFAPRVGDSGSKIIQSFLLFLRGCNPAATPISGGVGTGAPIEYRLRYDWPTSTWNLEPKPQDTSNAWTLTAFSDEEDAETLRFESLEIGVAPPEFNLCVTKGILGASVSTTSLVQSKPAVNVPSLIDSASPDYLGRLVMAELEVPPLSDQGYIDAMNARIYDAAAHRRLQPRTTTPYWADALTPMALVTIRGLDPSGARAALFGQPFWVKRRQLMIEEDGVQTMTLEMDTQWLGEIEL